jgi:Tol biopolymer transport system component
VSLAPGFRFGVYEIHSALGAGGMGEVYRARDTRLQRDVALKILPDTFADRERLARFEQEARVLASLNHPNIAAIFGIEEHGPVRGLVLELVDGPTLADRIGSRPLPLADALSIARQIAEALGAAHDRGITHRDLKPANIKVHNDGTVKVLDFGLAKSRKPDTSDASQALTMTSPVVTRAGVLLGTPAYMAPEQVTGQPADARSDIWAFGVVLYEVLTGRRAFVGDSTGEVLSNVLKAEIDWSALPPATPPAIHSLLRRCLQREPARRLRDITDARFQLEDAINAPSSLTTPAHRAGAGSMWVATALILAIAAGATGWIVGGWSRSQAELRLEINSPPTTDTVSLAMSPDGHRVAFIATADGRSALWVRSLDSVSARPLVGTENASAPFWSPGGESIGFFADGRLKRIDVESGTVQDLAAAAGGLGGTWNSDGIIVFSGGPDSPLFRVSASGGERTAVTHVNPQIVGHRAPQFLTDHRHFLFYAIGAAPGLYVGQLGSLDAPRRIMDDAQAATYAASGHLLFVRQGTLFAQKFDPVRLELSGTPVSVADRIVGGESPGLAAVSASAAGPIVYRAGAARALSELVWFDRSGKELQKVTGSASSGRSSVSLSPDGLRVAFEQTVTGEKATDISILDLGRGLPIRLTFDTAFDLYPVWSPDGRRVAFSSNRKGTWDLYLKPATGIGDDELLLGTNEYETSQGSWSRDGQFLLYAVGGGGTDIWALPVHGDRKPFPVVQTPFNEGGGRLSEDGKWIAYRSNESGRNEIYVQQFPVPGPQGKTRISTEGGGQVRWLESGTELFYLSADNQLMTVPTRLDPARGTVEVGTARALFTLRLRAPTGGWQYDVSRDGRRFLVDALQEVTVPITFVSNWKPQ